MVILAALASANPAASPAQLGERAPVEVTPLEATPAQLEERVPNTASFVLCSQRDCGGFCQGDLVTKVDCITETRPFRSIKDTYIFSGPAKECMIRLYSLPGCKDAIDFYETTKKPLTCTHLIGLLPAVSHKLMKCK